MNEHGISPEEAGQIATKSMWTIGLGSLAVFYVVYRFLIK